ncbi:5237_t:CDS:2, partial [Racocetra persica]
KKQHPFLKEVHSSNLQEKYPKPKPVHRHNSIIYSSPLERINGCGYKVDNSPLSKKKEVRKLKLALGQQNHHNIYLKLNCDNVEAKPLPAVDNKVGIDLNLTKQSYITLSNGKKYKHPKHYRKAEKILKIKQDILNRKTQKIANEIVRDYDKIVVENLHIDKMVQDSKLSQSIYQARWGILIKVLAEEAEIATRQLVKVNPKNTSQTCSLC